MDIISKELQSSRTNNDRRCCSRRTPIATLFAVPKPFEGESERHQRNAIHSWRRLAPDLEIILFGYGEKLQQVANECNATVLPTRENTLGTPRLDVMFSNAHQFANGEVMIYANADILFTIDLIEALRRLIASPFESFLATGRRTELKISDELPLADTAAWDDLFALARRTGRLDSIVCKDYFVFTRDLYQNIPEFLVGRGNWDNWIVYHAKQQSIPVIDLSRQVTAVHQMHGYNRSSGGRSSAYITGDEARHNQLVAGGRHLVCGSTATWRLTSKRLVSLQLPELAFIADLPRFLRLMLKLL